MKTIKNIPKIIQSKSTDSFSIETLKNMELKLNEKQEKLELKSQQIIKEIENKLDEHDGYAVIPLKVKLKKIHIEFNDNNEELVKLFNLKQSKILRSNLKDKLGSNLMVNIKESIMMILIMLVLGLLYYEFNNPSLSIETKNLLFWIDFTCCLIFLGNFYFEYRLADSKKWYWKKHFIDFITSIPLPDLSVLRFGRAVRLVRLTRLLRFVRVLRIFRGILFLSRGLNELAEIFNVKLMKKSFVYGLIFLVIGAIIINLSEGQSTNSVSTLIDSIWWSFTTVVTGGFADLYNPVSFIGRFLTVILIIAGMILVGIFTATLTSVIIGEDNEDDLNNLKKELNYKLDQIKKRLD